MINNAFLKTLNILYVESDPNTGKHFFNILNKIFNNVIYFQTSKDAIKAFEQSKNFTINIIICDVQLKDENGTFVLKEIREIDKDVPFILTTKETNTSDLLEAIKLNVDDFLIKPINAKDLILTVEKICHNKYQNSLENQSVKDLESMIGIINEIALVTKTNTKGEITFVNDGFLKVSGYREDELLGKELTFIRDPKTSKITTEEINNTLNNGNIWEGKLKNYSKNDEEFFVFLTAIPIFDTNEKIKEFILIRFLITEYEQEQRTFKKNVAKNIHKNRRVNNEAREKIDELMKKLSYYKTIDGNILLEQQRDSKFTSQLKHYEKEITESEEKLNSISEIANKRIKEIIKSEKLTREKKIETDNELNTLTTLINQKNRKIKSLTLDLDFEKKTIKELEQKIGNIESNLN